MYRQTDRQIDRRTDTHTTLQIQPKLLIYRLTSFSRTRPFSTVLTYKVINSIYSSKSDTNIPT